MKSNSPELADAMLKGIDVDMSRSINLAEWLVYCNEVLFAVRRPRLGELGTLYAQRLQ